jgi:glycine cleavage system H protein
MTDLTRLRYTPTHEWVLLEGKSATVGITEHAQKEISDVVFVELPKIEKSVRQKDSVMIIESVKAAFDIYAPLSGKVTKINETLKNHPELVNKSPYEKGWLYQLEVSDPKEFDLLLTQSQYDNVKEAAH